MFDFKFKRIKLDKDVKIDELIKKTKNIVEMILLVYSEQLL